MQKSAPREVNAPEQVLSTLHKDGSRHWLYPRVSPGRFLLRRRWVAYLLIVIYNLLPWLPINGKPALLLDFPTRQFTFFGTTFLPTDTLLLMLFVAAIFVLIFLLTALLGRVWCGWACPQTVYMEFIYRPIERLFEGAPSATGKRPASVMPWRIALKYLVYFIVSLHLAHTFLAYFVGATDLFNWTMQSPFEHPRAFLLVMFVTGLMMFNFCWFREQTCIVACPYGRFQSVLLDRQSLIISYDDKRGEPRGKKRSTGARHGDCIDCRMCVTTCPTGIDIRSGLQMECIGCAQCIDACDHVMDSIGTPRGLIRYSSQDAMESGVRRLLRPRIVLYPAILLVLSGAFLGVLLYSPAANVFVTRAGGTPYRVIDDDVRNDLVVRIVNRTNQPRTYRLAIDGLVAARIASPDMPLTLGPGTSATAGASVLLDRQYFVNGRTTVFIMVHDDEGFTRSTRWQLQGPWNTPPRQSEEQP